MAKSIEVAPEGQWFFKYVESEKSVFVKLNDSRFSTKNDLLTEEVQDIKHHSNKSYQRYVLITFKVTSSPSGSIKVRFDLDQFDAAKTSFKEKLGPLTRNEKEFCATFRKNAYPASAATSDAPLPPAYSSQATSHKPQATKRRVSAGVPVASTAELELASPNKKNKIMANDIDQKIDSRYIGHFHLNVDFLSDDCPAGWLDREVDPGHVEEIINILDKSPTTAKGYQPWLGIAEIRKEDVKTKDVMKGCRITVIGGRHRQAAYKKLKDVSDVHKRELEKVWVHVYDNQLTEEEVRRLSAMHNVVNKGSMSTPWMTRVNACRQWLYTLASKDISIDETPPSTQAWKKACQTMYVAKDKDPNTLEPTLQAALLRGDVYEVFAKVGDMYSLGELKDQKNQKKKTKSEVPQSKLGMPLQGLNDETKLELLRQIVRKEISLEEMKKKCQRIKKKQLVLQAFLRHTGEESYETLSARFPLHTTEEKLAQFSTSPISRKSIPQEVTAFFERAIMWERKKASNSLNLHEEREGVYFFEKGEASAILMEGSLASIPLERIRRMITVRPFKGFSLVLATLSKEATNRELTMLLTSIHAANVDYHNVYNIAIVAHETTVAMCREVVKARFTTQQDAYWVNTKHQKHGGLLHNCLRPIVLGHWSKDGTMTEAHCHFQEDESASNVFSFKGEEEEIIPKDLSTHIIKHFSYEGQWVLDLTESKGSGIKAALTSGRNCVSLMDLANLRKTAEVVSVNDDKDEDEDEDEDEDVDEDVDNDSNHTDS